jgi:putative endonuclease
VSTKTLGEQGERLAATWLQRRGYRVVERNYRSRLGEIDLVCRHGGELVFVEVKTRASSEFADPVESVTAAKQRKLRRLAEEYVISRRLEDADVRFDVLGVTVESNPPAFDHIKGAF